MIFSSLAIMIHYTYPFYLLFSSFQRLHQRRSHILRQRRDDDDAFCVMAGLVNCDRCVHMDPDYHQMEFDLRVYLTYKELVGDLY